MKTGLIVLTFFLSAAVFAYAQLITSVIRLDDVEYNIFTTGNHRLSREELNFFHAEFTASVKQLFSEYNIKTPHNFKVNLCLRASVFKKITGREWHVAGLYDPLTRQFYFQNPASLRKRNIATVVVRHELTHMIIHESRDRTSENDNMFWLEESFCEALYPVPKNSVSLKSIMKRISSLQGLKKYLSIALRSSNRKKKTRAYSLAQAWGSHMINSIGEKRFFNILTGKMKNDLIRRNFIFFKKRFD